MLVFSSQNGTSVTLVVVFVVMLVLGFALDRYVEWSSNARLAEFMSATDTSTTHASPVQPRKGCNQGAKFPPVALSRPLD
jgi:hypothetical protein